MRGHPRSAPDGPQRVKGLETFQTRADTRRYIETAKASIRIQKRAWKKHHPKKTQKNVKTNTQTQSNLEKRKQNTRKTTKTHTRKNLKITWKRWKTKKTKKRKQRKH